MGGRIFHVGDNVMWHRLVSSIAVGCIPLLNIEWSLLLHGVIDERMIHFAAYTAAEASSAFQWPRQPPKIAHTHGHLDPIQYVVSGPIWVSPKRHLDRFSRFCTADPWAQTHRHTHRITLHATSVAIYRIYALCEMRLNNTLMFLHGQSTMHRPLARFVQSFCRWKTHSYCLCVLFAAIGWIVTPQRLAAVVSSCDASFCRLKTEFEIEFCWFLVNANVDLLTNYTDTVVLGLLQTARTFHQFRLCSARTKHSAVVARLIVTADTAQKCPFPWGFRPF